MYFETDTSRFRLQAALLQTRSAQETMHQTTAYSDPSHLQGTAYQVEIEDTLKERQ